MSRNVTDATITTPTSRAKLPMRSKPYFRSIDPKLCIGYGKSKDGGHWLMRAYDGDGRYHQERIGVADDHQKADGVTVLDYAQACKVARDRHMRRNRRRKALQTQAAPTRSSTLSPITSCTCATSENPPTRLRRG